MRWAGAATLAVPLLAACATGSPLMAPEPAALARAAPDSFEVRFETTRGDFVVRARRAWSPLGVDRFHYLAGHGYYDGARFFRVITGFVAQFGLSGRPELDSAWAGRSIPDEPVRHSNLRGTMSYARGGPNTRSVQLYLNLVDNVRLDTLNTFGFPAIAEVVAGMEVVDSLYAGYGGSREQRLPGPSQDSIRVAGNAYLDREFPNLDLIRKARVGREWR
ncbi:MAG: peptidyl-prolyl cis-trans isomerase cyclophilin type [Gemmatimonadetes bacterium]|nr:peptidyl-prolyl cis-trans isomerase cyclophilin type [Gemmatimonadota bacterium]